MTSAMLISCSLALLASGCAMPEILDKAAPAGAMDQVHLFSHEDDHAANLVERALSTCPEGTEAAMTRCMRGALSSSRISAASLAAAIPGCRPGLVCTYDYTTRRRVGFFSAWATVIVKDWRVTFDLRGASAVPVTVADRNVFVVPSAAAAKPARAPVPAR